MGKYKEIGVPMDRSFRTVLNENFEEISNDILGMVSNIDKIATKKIDSNDIKSKAVFPIHTSFLKGASLELIEKNNRTITKSGTNWVYSYNTSLSEKCMLASVEPGKIYAITTTGSKLIIAQGLGSRDAQFYAGYATQDVFCDAPLFNDPRTEYILTDRSNNTCLLINTNIGATVTVIDMSQITIDDAYTLSLPKNTILPPITKNGTDFIGAGVNKFNKDSDDIILNTIITAGGVIQSSSASNLTNKIKVKKGDSINFFNDSYMGSASSPFKGGVFDANDKLVGVFNSSYPGLVIDTTNKIGSVIISELSASYVRFNFNDTNRDKWMVVINESYPKQYIPYYYKLDSSIKLDQSQLIPSNSEPTKTLERIYPDKIYVTCNDVKNDNYKFGKARQYSAALYLDHCVPDTIDDSAYIVGDKSPEKDKAYFYNPSFYDGNYLRINNGNNIDIAPKVVEIKSNTYKVDRFTVNQVSTKASISKDKNSLTLIIGDSQSQDVGMSPRYGNGENSYAGYLMKYFSLDKIDAGNKPNEYRNKTLGTRISEPVKFNYAGTDVDMLANSEGYASFCLYDLLHHPDRIRADQTTWDAKGLGDGTGTDYKGTSEQKDRFALANYSSDISEPVNKFYDNSKTGNSKFSLLKWIERYRTCDDNGNKLTLDDPNKGTLVTTQSFIDKYNVCKPTHVVINLGRNDLASSSVSAFMQNLQYMIDAIKSELPDVVIGICMTPDKAGTFFPSRYSKILDIDRMSARMEYEAVKQMKTTFGDMESNNVYLIPLYFIQPTAWGKALQEVSMPESLLGEPGYNQDSFRRYRVLVDGPETHPGSQTHLAWGYQVYSWMKYVMSK
ncbi:SGNH/GDSL hydrolase family protein [Bacillus cereus group sp. BfR-BA-01425]|uniref:SGNH/GDSL hydrolase family protein n=1 Tax=Bacillus cereus group sp. BfR-BA-01425 TaxID=2920342 RepID=UPI001F5928E6|nr:SGNH/GDSL hydrolase family protein [Bacillus cereus group sp. BfR-BA-01425]